MTEVTKENKNFLLIIKLEYRVDCFPEKNAHLDL